MLLHDQETPVLFRAALGMDSKGASFGTSPKHQRSHLSQQILYGGQQLAIVSFIQEHGSNITPASFMNPNPERFALRHQLKRFRFN